MRKLISIYFLLCAIALATVVSCKKENSTTGYKTTPYTLSIPSSLPAMQIPADNPLTVEGVALGRKLFYDPILSANGKQSCASCHRQNYAFTDSTLALSIGVDNVEGVRNAMPLFNLGFQKKFFWDGGAADLESQVIGPIQNPLEMHETLPNLVQKLQNNPVYPNLFYKAFGTNQITIPMLMKAIAQFERTMISGNAKYDKYKRGEIVLTAQEMNGLALFQNDKKGDCIHCHTLGSTFSDFEFRNTGLDSIYTDAGRYKITLKAADSGKFKTPSLRNVAVTAPYMHDGRFKTLQECLDHYNTGFHYTSNLDGALQIAVKGRMTNQDMSDIIAFLKTLTDTSFLNNPNFSNPN